MKYLALGDSYTIGEGVAEDGRWPVVLARARTTRRIDSLSRALGWMNAGPKRYPNADALRARFDAAGLASEFTPLYAGTPFNNWRVVASYPPGNPQR